jgi:hypothetical protein
MEGDDHLDTFSVQALPETTTCEPRYPFVLRGVFGAMTYDRGFHVTIRHLPTGLGIMGVGFVANWTLAIKIHTEQKIHP